MFQILLHMRKLTHAASPKIISSPNIPPLSPNYAWLDFESIEKFMSITKTMHATEFFPVLASYLIVCGDKYVSILTFTGQRNDFFWSGWRSSSSARVDESEYVHCDASRSISLKSIVFLLLHLRYEEIRYFRRFIFKNPLGMRET